MDDDYTKTVAIKEGLHRRIDIYCAKSGSTIRDIVEESLEKFLKGKE